jgi:peptidylprolyl isomerase
MTRKVTMKTAETGDKVKIEFSGKTKDGFTFVPVDNPEKVEFTIGKGEVIPGLDEGVVGMQVGETKTVDVSSDRAFGPYNKDMVAELDPKSIPPGQEVKEGQTLELHRADGQSIPAIVLSVTKESVMIDANHPLSGRDLEFTITLVNII